MTQKIEIVSLLPSHAEQVAAVHIKCIDTGFISSLGINFVTSLYEAIAYNDLSFGCVAQQDNQVVGFVAFTSDLNSLYRSAIRTKGLRFALLLGTKMLYWKNIKRILETLFYPRRVKQLDLPSAELLSIAVVPALQGRGLAKQLIQKGLEECSCHHLKKIKVLVAAENGPANKLYEKSEFALFGQILNHQVLSNIYVKQI